MNWSAVSVQVMLTLAVLIASSGRALQLRRDWVRHGLSYFSDTYLVAVLVGDLLLAVVAFMLGAQIAMAVCLAGAALYGWMIGSRYACTRTRRKR